MTIKKATDFQIQPLEQEQELILSFHISPGNNLQVKLALPMATEVMATLAHCLASNPNEAARMDPVHRLSVRNISAGSWKGMPALSYELELGVTATTSIELQDAIRLRDELSAVIDAAPRPSTTAH